MSWDFGGNSDSGAGDAWESRDQPTAPAPTAGQPDFNREPPAPHRDGAGLTTTSPPLLWLALSLVLAVLAIVVHLVTDGWVPAMFAWLLGGPVAIGLFAVFVQVDTSRRSDPFYAESELADWARRAVVVLSLVAVALNAWSIADHIARSMK